MYLVAVGRVLPCRTGTVQSRAYRSTWLLGVRQGLPVEARAYPAFIQIRDTDMKDRYCRRDFIVAAAVAGVALAREESSGNALAVEKPAILGGRKTRTAPWPLWPVKDVTDEKAVAEVVRSGRWFRGGGNEVNRFEDAYARLLGAKHCVAVSSGTGALVTALGALDIGPGDEVIVPPYTFIATVNAVLLHYALPVFVDTDPDTFQINARKINAAISPRTAAVLPVHIGGSPADMDAIAAIAAKHKLAVIEDACHAPLAEWRGRKLGTCGTAGCFSFQVSKMLAAGEGGAILTDDRNLAQRLYGFHNNGNGRRIGGASAKGGRTANFRMTEFQGALLGIQMTRLEQQAQIRQENGNYLTSLLKEIPGIVPAKTYDGCTRNAFHHYMLRYQAEHFAGLPRARFTAALRAEGIQCSHGYGPLNREAFLAEAFSSRGFQRIYSQAELKRWEDRNRCPENDRLCAEAVWFAQPMLLGERSDMEQIAEAIRRIQAYAAGIAKA